MPSTTSLPVPSLPTLLETIATSVTTATTALPDSSVLSPPPNSLSLLSIKNELLLSYLHNLSYLLLIKLQNATHSSSPLTSTGTKEDDAAVVAKLVELRLYLEKGVRPLEGKLQYQLDKVLRAADDTAATATATAVDVTSRSQRHGSSASTHSDSDSDSDSGAQSHPANAPPTDPPVSDLAHRPNPSSFLRPQTASKESPTQPTPSTSASGAYRPPHLNPVLPPTSTGNSTRRARPPPAALADYLSTSTLAAHPTPLPSIGSTTTHAGRRTQTATERARNEYEEANYTRLAPLSKKEKQRERIKGAGGTGFGGAELNAGGAGGFDGFEGLEGMGGKSKGEGALERSRRRKREEGPGDGIGGGGGTRIGAETAKRRRMLGGKRRGR
ncbi:MAG: hypothetical protein M1833_000661 [Piccolia ochrophora]|nr:MAG: hypothetical protein M1833_000661 [Piccolia ochrophora]